MAGIYIHIPFCKQACTYCDFHFSTTFAPYREAMLAGLQKELLIKSEQFSSCKVTTLYFGGGTPSILTEKELSLLVATIQENYKLDLKEVTLEANPDDITFEKLAYWKKLGIDRLSIGVQSFNDKDLQWMNRAHNSKEANRSLSLAKEADFKISLDLIYGLPNRTLAEWEENIKKALSYHPEHISAYCLTVEEKTALAHWVKTKKISLVDDETQSAQFLLLIDFLQRAGYEQYEVSNFARDQFYAKHNSNYWLGVPFLGIGPGAHEYDGKTRSWNISNNQQYIKLIQDNKVFYEKEYLSAKDQFNEYIMTRLRTKWGILINELEEILEPTNEFYQLLNTYVSDGLLMHYKESNTYCLSSKGKLLADRIAEQLFIV